MDLALDARGHWDGLIVLCAANRYDSVKVADQHLAERLCQLAPVLYVDPPMSRLTAARRPDAAAALHGPRLRVLQPGLARLTPVVQPFPSRAGLTGMTSALTRRQLRRAAARLGGRVRAVVSGWPQYPVFGSCGEQTSVYWAQDDFVGGAALLGLNAALLDTRERQVAARADLLVAANPVVADTWQRRGLGPVLIPFGADVDAYRDVERAPLPDDARLPGPVAGFVGRINDRTDLSLLEDIAGRGRSLLLVGPKKPAFEPDRFEALVQRSNVRWVGEQPFGALPGYLRAIDVGVVPYRDSPFNRSSFPLKALEYLAAGRAVVSTDLPAIRWLATDLVTVAAGPASFGDQVDRLLAEPRTPAMVARRQEFAARHSWTRRAADMYDAILSAPPHPTTPRPPANAGYPSPLQPPASAGHPTTPQRSANAGHPTTSQLPASAGHPTTPPLPASAGNPTKSQPPPTGPDGKREVGQYG
jgi:teichuronic acid biosynthesis glycosyltransferase TuaH